MGQQFTCLLLIALVAFSGANHAEGHDDRHDSLRDNYYEYSCPDAESVIQKTVNAKYDKDLKLAVRILRMLFHDCFVEGCDASILLDGSETEKHAPVNEKLSGYEVIDAAKAAVEEICPGVVSCADILAYAARDGTVKLNGSSWNVQGGRKDGFHSSAEQAEADLPAPEFEVSELIDSFERRGLTKKQMVVLSGAHTVGVAHCDKVVGRLYNFNEEHFTDPTIDPDYAEQLKQQCPQNTFNTSIELIVPFDVITPGEFDSFYYESLQQNKGLFTSDQSLFLDNRTKKTVKSLARNRKFQKVFGKAMRALAAVGVKTESDGEIRTDCRYVNSNS